MGLGSTARKIQGLTDTAEELYRKLSEVLERVRDIESAIDETQERVSDIDARLDRQAVLIEAIAAEHEIDVEGLAIEDAAAKFVQSTEDDEPAEEAQPDEAAS